MNTNKIKELRDQWQQNKKDINSQIAELQFEKERNENMLRIVTSRISELKEQVLQFNGALQALEMIEKEIPQNNSNNDKHDTVEDTAMQNRVSSNV